MNAFKFMPRIATLLCLGLSLAAQAEERTPVAELREGHWVELRGVFMPDGEFWARRVFLVQPDRYETLTGTVTEVADAGHFALLGQRVEVLPRTTFSRIEPADLPGSRVKVEGYFRNEGMFSARKVYPRGAGRDRITGRVDSVTHAPEGTSLRVMGYTVRLPDQAKAQHELAFGEYQVSAARVQAIIDRNRDEDDLFGRGIRLTDKLRLAGQLSMRGTYEDEFDLNHNRDRDLEDYDAALRLRMVYRPASSLFAVAEISHRRIIENDDRDGRLEDDKTRLGETYLYWLDPFGRGLDLQVGRMDYDDEREWLYDQNLDAVRAIWTGERIRTELSYSEVLSGGGLVDESASNSMLYISNNDRHRTLAGYIVHRDYDLPVPVRRTHYGVRVLGKWLPDNELWLELAAMDGREGLVSTRGWAFDIGTTWEFHDRFSLTLGYAYGQGDNPGSATDNTFRQTGLEDNNGKFAGVTSFRYYGELMDPELANIKITTLGVGWRPRRRVSLDLVAHTYRQDELSRRLVDAGIGKRPNGIDRDLGLEVDLVLGWRTSRTWDLEAILAWFRPGDAFGEDADDAYLGKLQFRYRF